jgi:hypothetical protein
MVYIYYHVTSVSDFKEIVSAYFEEGKKHGLERLMQRGDQPELFMEIVSVGANIGEPLKGLSDLRAKHGINKLILNNKIHVEVFEQILGPS